MPVSPGCWSSSGASAWPSSVAWAASGGSAVDSLRPASGGRLQPASSRARTSAWVVARARRSRRSEEHTSELQSPCNLVCRLLLEKKKNTFAHLLFRLGHVCTGRNLSCVLHPSLFTRAFQQTTCSQSRQRVSQPTRQCRAYVRDRVQCGVHSQFHRSCTTSVCSSEDRYVVCYHAVFDLLARCFPWSTRRDGFYLRLASFVSFFFFFY